MADKDSKYDPLVIEKVFPSPSVLLKDSPPAVDVMTKECLFVLDANTLLAPFLIGRESLKDVKKVFASLVSQDRLFLPAQAVREYAKHRASKIADIYTHIQQRLSSLPPNPQPMAIPMFEDVPAYIAVMDGADKVRGAVKEYKTKLQELLSQIRNWHGDDPVSTLYASIFLESHVIEHGKQLDELSADLEYRTTHGVPPGFKDKAKPDGGIGDVAIWHTIMRLGNNRKRDVIFVSNDAKSDWMVRGGDEGLFPKFELITEFHRLTGHHFWILPFDRFLELLGAAPETVVEVASTTDVSGTLFSTPITTLENSTAHEIPFSIPLPAEMERKLTPREITIAACLLRNWTSEQIANELTISVLTVKVHVRNIFAKLGVDGRADLLYQAARLNKLV